MNSDFLIIGAGILGLSLARELRYQHPNASITLLEKEPTIGLHASGRNSGVLHAGIYYSPETLKAKVCREGAAAMAEYCQMHGLPFNRIGKIVLPLNEHDEQSLTLIQTRATANGVTTQLIDQKELKNKEPTITSPLEKALWVPDTAVIDSQAILKHITSDLINSANVFLHFNARVEKINTTKKTVSLSGQTFAYGHLFNTAGLHADKIARICGGDARYTLLPFKGFYYELKKDIAQAINHLIYPVPDLNVPFLGVHLTKTVHGKTYIGPTAIPAFGRENYQGWHGLDIMESIKNLRYLAYQYTQNKRGFRTYVHQEIPRMLRSQFLLAAKKLLPSLKAEDLLPSNKAGIRAQLYDKKNQELMMDFVVTQTKNETHVLNAVSPAFTSAFSFVKTIVNYANE